MDQNIVKRPFTGLYIKDNKIKIEDFIYEIPNGKILDLGCGSVSYRQEIKSPIVGVDIQDIGGVDIVGNLCEISTWENFADNQFDFIMSLASLHWFGDSYVWGHESYRVLKKGGKFLHYFIARDSLKFKCFSALGMPVKLLTTNNWMRFDEISTKRFFEKNNFKITNVRKIPSIVEDVKINYIMITGEKE